MSVVEDSGSTVVLDSLAAFLQLWRLAVHAIQAYYEWLHVLHRFNQA